STNKQSVPVLHGLDEAVAKRNDRALHSRELFGRQPASLDEVHVQTFLAQAPPGIGQGDQDLTLIFMIALPAQVTHSFELLENGRERVGLEKKLLAQAADRLVVLLPQRDDRDVLRIGQTQFLKNRLVGLAKREIGRINGEAQEVGKFQVGGIRRVSGFHCVLV